MGIYRDNFTAAEILQDKVNDIRSRQEKLNLSN